MRRPTPLEVSRDPAPTLREVRANVQRGYRHLVGASRLRAAVRDVWLLAEALAFATGEKADLVGELATPLSPEEQDFARMAFPKPVREARPRTQLERRTPLERGGPIKRKPRAPLSPADAVWVERVHAEPCVGIQDFPGHVCWSPDDEHPIDASHVGRRDDVGSDGRRGGMSRKGPWTHTIPKCRRLHIQMGALAGPFKGWTRGKLLAWGMAHVRRLEEKFAREAA